MNLPDEIKTIDDVYEVTTIVNKSSFIAQVYPINSEADLKEQLIKAKKKYYQASHHCFAFKLVDGTIRYSDAGEPNGTAGIRILNAIEHFKLSNQLVIVSRIFGGIKLGVGPLGKAYYQSAYNVLNDSKINIKQLFQNVTISSNFEYVNLIHRILGNHKSIILSSEYEDNLEISCLLRLSEVELIGQKLTEAGKNKISLNLSSELLYK
jgi:uncharacterized YigZ family protein